MNLKNAQRTRYPRLNLARGSEAIDLTFRFWTNFWITAKVKKGVTKHAVELFVFKDRGTFFAAYCKKKIYFF